MGRKGSWISAVKKVISPPSKEKKEKGGNIKKQIIIIFYHASFEQKTRKSKGWFWKKNRKGLDSIQEGIDHAQPSPVREVRLAEAEGEQMKYVDSVMEADNYSVSHPYSLMNTEIVQDNHANLAMDAETEQERHARATANASEAAVAAAQAAAEVVRLTASVRSSAKSKEEIAAIKIQSIFKGYMARRSLRSIKGLVRLKKLVQGQSLKRQAITTLRCMQTMSRVQAEVRARRIRMSEENCAFQRQLQQKHRKELEKSRASVGEDWNGSAQSKEQFEANQQRKRGYKEKDYLYIPISEPGEIYQNQLTHSWIQKMPSGAGIG
ncbi:hypothetical protein Leryth_026095 [Lithospermum erythrorhizon]|nr:hypothetical protein Leryth_026095 [Lithospermum erythrorhizon]